MSTKTAPESALKEQMEAAILADSVPQLKAAIEHAADLLDLEECTEFMNDALKNVVRGGKTALAEHLLHEGADITALNVLDVGQKPSIALFDLLKSYEYDFNKAGPPDPMAKGRTPIYKVTHDAELIQWLLDHRVSVDLGQEDYWYWARPPLLLQECASIGSVASFKAIKERGAKVGRRTLHTAVKEAAVLGCDPDDASLDSREVDKDGPTRGLIDLPEWLHKRNRVEMLRYLVGELHLDVNGLDSDDQSQPSAWGTPLRYAQRQEGTGADVAKWLLKNGADPNAPPLLPMGTPEPPQNAD
ncbi:uncharacterized protein N0V89_003001 [Didymosphaeria variabile]|uniref:Ankyrin n=1 Tax=Didymosphaeria variabile TaxID=1932322 RepID=A0A9W9CF33_9PLEO|nr:uncharacterized protein N0V89_003001 [Didymosphaeria variabile]KAJ4358419.1 hypothetical protein N0V89_003001 [Didymosphaeria variabile]